MSLVDKNQFLAIWFKECMERAQLVLEKIEKHDYIMDDVEEQQNTPFSENSLTISTEERIDMFKYFAQKYEHFDNETLQDYMFSVEFLTVLHPKEFSFVSLYQMIEDDRFENKDSEILKELLLHVKKFFKRRSLSPSSGYLKRLLDRYREEQNYNEIAGIVFTISFMCKDVSSLLDYPKEFFKNSLSGLDDAYNPVSLTNTMQIINEVFSNFNYEASTSNKEDFK